MKEFVNKQELINLLKRDYNMKDKTKDSWTKDEVENLLLKFVVDFPLHRGIQIFDADIKSWVKNNL